MAEDLVGRHLLLRHCPVSPSIFDHIGGQIGEILEERNIFFVEPGSFIGNEAQNGHDFLVFVNGKCDLTTNLRKALGPWLIRPFNPGFLGNRLLDNLAVCLAETAIDSVFEDSAVEGSHIILGFLIKHDKTGFLGLGEDHPSLVPDLLQDFSNVKGGGDLLRDPFHTFESFFVGGFHQT